MRPSHVESQRDMHNSQTHAKQTDIKQYQMIVPEQGRTNVFVFPVWVCRHMVEVSPVFICRKDRDVILYFLRVLVRFTRYTVREEAHMKQNA